MNNREIFDECRRIERETELAQDKISKLQQDHLSVMSECPHDIVFKYLDNHPRRVIIEGNYICPACGKTIQFLTFNQLKDTPFRKSRIIPLYGLSLSGSQELFRVIKEEVYNNLSFYYNKDMSVDALSTKMYSVLKHMDDDYYKKDSIIKKLTKK